MQHDLWLRQLPLEVHSDLSDAQVAALAAMLEATLVHKDPEFKALGQSIRQELLPLKGPS